MMLLKTCLSAHAIHRHIGSTVHRIVSRNHSIKVAIVGSGPAGFYTAQGLLKNTDLQVDIYEKLPVPFGLVRYGVAPDHAEVKNVIKSFTSVANNDRVNFYGNVGLGDQISLEDLVNAYHAVVLCYGSSTDKMLGIEGEHSKNTISARNFVGWYNGVPDDKDLDVNLDCDTACIVGQGNVALDCARILLRPKNLEKTDITSHAQKLLAGSKIRRIFVIGRRGPIQVAFTIKELRELIKLNEGMTRIEPASIFEDIGLKLEHTCRMPRQRRRITELLIDLSLKNSNKFDSVVNDRIELIFKFLSKPSRIITDSKTSKVTAMEIQRMSYPDASSFADENARPDETEDVEKIDCGLIIRSIGYKASIVDKSLPFNHRVGAIMNTDGRIQGYKNLYCSGWLATGATGVIAGTLNSSQVTSRAILDDLHNGHMPNLAHAKPGYDMIRRVLATKKVQVVHFNDWLRIDELERRLGEILGKPREKITDVAEMLAVASGNEK